MVGCGDDGAGALQSLQPSLRVRKEEFRTVLATHGSLSLKDFLLDPKASRCSPGTAHFSITVRVHTLPLTSRQRTLTISGPHMDGLPAN